MSHLFEGDPNLSDPPISGSLGGLIPEPLTSYPIIKEGLLDKEYFHSDWVANYCSKFKEREEVNVCHSWSFIRFMTIDHESQTLMS